MSQVTVVIPIGNYHLDIAKRALESVQNQTVPCEVLAYSDVNSRGSGFIRNVGLKEVTSEYVVFLDADDQILPTFVERCLAVIKPGRYVYTDWFQEDGVHKASDNPWQPFNGEWHVLTSLLRTEDVRAVGGFDETVTGAEDTLLYWALTRAGICGIALHEPLFTYGKEGRRAREFVSSPAYEPTMRGLLERYGEDMCCGGDSLKENFTPDQPGDVEALAMWGGNRRERGPATGRLYPRGGNMNPMSVNPADIAAAPHMWQRVYPQPTQPPAQPAIFAHERPQPTVMRTVLVDGVGELVEKMYPGVKVIREPEPATVLTADQLAKTLPEIKAKTPENAKRVRTLAKGKGKAR